jgi:hypothetical protein
MLDVCTTGVTAHIDKISKFLPTRISMGASIFFTFSGRNVNYYEKQLSGGKKNLELFLLSVQVY